MIKKLCCSHKIFKTSMRSWTKIKENNAKLCCMDTDSFIIHIKTEDVFEDIANDVEKIFDISNYKVAYRKKQKSYWIDER